MITLLLTVLSIALAVVPLLDDPLIGVVLLAAAVVAGVVILIYALYLRDRYGGLYRIVEDSDVWDLHGEEGQDATMTKTRQLAYLQDGVFAIRDYAWGEGTIHDSRVIEGPGRAVYHYYQQRRNTIILLSRPADRDDEHVFKIERRFEGTFTEPTESVQADILHQTEKLTVTVLFPPDRPPKKAWLTCRLGGHEESENLSSKEGPDGRQKIERTFKDPPQFAIFTLNWEW